MRTVADLPDPAGRDWTRAFECLRSRAGLLRLALTLLPPEDRDTVWPALGDLARDLETDLGVLAGEAALMRRAPAEVAA